MQASRNYPQAAPQFRRAGPVPGAPIPGPPPQRPPQHEYFEQQQRIREAHESAKRRSQKPVDRNLPDGIEDLVLGDAAEKYNELRETEKTLDAVMMRKRLDIQDTLQVSQPRAGILRIWISNTVENQPWQASGMDHDAFDFSSNVEALFRVKIEGRLLDDDDEADAQDGEEETGADTKDTEGDVAMDDGGEGDAPKRAKPSQKPASRKRLSHFFKKIDIEFDRPAALQPDNYARIEWAKPDLPPHGHADLPKEADFDRLEFQRKGDENVNITINLTRDEPNPRYKLSPALADLLDAEVADRKTALMGIWEYVKLAGLQDETDSRRVNCDARLKRVVGVDSFYFPQLVQFGQRLMFDAPPISLSYTIRVDRDFHSSGTPQATIYDVPVPLDDPLQEQMEAIKSSPGHTQTMQAIMRMDDGLAVLVQNMKHAKAKHGFFTSMSKDPANFTKRWISSQKRDLDVILGAGPWGEEDWQSAAWRQGGADGPWGTQEAWEGIGAYLTRQDQLNKTRAGPAA